MTTEHIQLNVVGMSCEHCRCRVQRTLEAVAGVRAATVDLTTGTANVEVDPETVTREQLAAEVEKIGYAVGDMSKP